MSAFFMPSVRMCNKKAAPNGTAFPIKLNNEKLILPLCVLPRKP